MRDFVVDASIDCGDIPNVSSFLAWVFGCPCCEQIDIEKMRNRPSPFRISTLQFLSCFFAYPSSRGQILRWFKSWIPHWMLHLHLPALLTYITPAHNKHIDPKAAKHSYPTKDILWQCEWGDDQLLIVDNDDDDNDGVEWTLNPKVELIEEMDPLGVEDGTEYILEALSPWKNTGVCVWHPVTNVKSYFQLSNKNAIAAIKSKNMKQQESFARWMKQSCIWMPVGIHSWRDDQVKRMRQELKQQGWTKLQRHAYLPPAYWNAVRCYYQKINQWMQECDGHSKFKTYNDEPVARQLNFDLTGFVESVLQRRLVQSSLALSIYIEPGEGFVSHTDSSPPFDITLDMVLDHKGASRPIYVCRPQPQSIVPVVEELNLAFGESVLFEGSTLEHWGGYLGPSSHHQVILWTFQYAD